MTRKFFAASGAVASLLIASSALAADLPYRKAPPPAYIAPPPPPMWTGFYVGLNAGGTWAANNQTDTITVPVFSNPGLASPIPSIGAAALVGSTFNSNGSNGGFIGGGQIGYNWQFGSSFLVGVETDIQGIASGNNNNAGVTSAAIIPGVGGSYWLATTRSSRNLDYLGTVRGRLGYLVTPTLLLFGTGGLAYGGVNFNTNIAWAGVTPPGGVAFANSSVFFGGTPFSDTRVGWTAGGGLEWMFWPNWSAKVEYLFYDLGRSTANFVSLRPTPGLGNGVGFILASQSRSRFDGNIVRVGLNYHFNWGASAPVVAKY